jgi:hypothetical protein
LIGEAEIHRQPAAPPAGVSRGPIGEQLFDVRGAFERFVVQAGQDAVARDGEVLLDEVGPWSMASR